MTNNNNKGSDMMTEIAVPAADEVDTDEVDGWLQSERERRPKDFEALREMRELEASVSSRLVTVYVDAYTIVSALPQTLTEHLKGLGMSKTRIDTCIKTAEQERDRGLHDRIAQLWQAGHSTAEISGMTGRSVTTVCRVLNKRGLRKRQDN